MVEIRRVYPADLLVIVKLEITGQVGGPIGQQVDFNVGVAMMASTDEAAHAHVDAELLLQLPPEASFGGLALFDLPAGKFPFVRQSVPAFAAGNEDPAVFFEDGGSNRYSSDIKTRGCHPFQTLTTRLESVKVKTLESGVDLWNNWPSF
jgi:hypothetical protein